jgi:hypothetical protein
LLQILTGATQEAKAKETKEHKRMVLQRRKELLDAEGSKLTEPEANEV